MMDKNIFTIARSTLKDKAKMLLSEDSTKFEDAVDVLRQQNLVPSEEEVQQEINAIHDNGFDVISLLDNNYPKSLKLINNAPLVLTYQGNIDILNNKLFAVVGSRKLESNDDKIIEKITDVINSVGCKVVSGLARGTDIIAQKKSMKFGTIAVLPCGLSHCYPKEHEIFFKKIIDNGGLVLSEYSFFEPPRQRNFIQRNRIITGLSIATFVGRCVGIKTGTMSSAMFAKNQGRKIYTYKFGGKNLGNKYLIDNNIAQNIVDTNTFAKILIKDLKLK